MRARQSVACPVVALCLLLTPHFAGSATAAPPVETSGTYTSVLTGGTAPAGSGNATFFQFSNAIALSGSYTGTGTAHYRWVQVGTEFFRCHGEQVLTGVVDGVRGVGTLTSRVLLECDLRTGSCSSQSVSTSGTGALADVHAVTRSTSVLGQPRGSYSGKLVRPGR